MEILSKLEALPQEEREPIIRRLMATAYSDSLYLTAKMLLGYRDVNWRTHGDMIRALEDSTDRKLIVMPRGTFKSSISSVSYPIQCLTKNWNLRVLIDSEVYTNAKNFLREIAQHLEGEKFTQMYGPTRGSTWNEGEITVAQRTKVLKEASITASGIGAEKTSQHYDLIIMDDLNSPKNSATPEGREKVINHFKYNMALLEPGGTAVLVGTRYAANDAIGFVLKNEMGISR
jgi:hypothetical protein